MYKLKTARIFLHILVLAAILISVFNVRVIYTAYAQSEVVDGNTPVQSPVLQPAPALSPSAYAEMAALSMSAENAQTILPAGTDTRWRITPTSSIPWQRIAHILFYYQGTTQNPNPTKICTGFFIGPYTVATAGHCVYDTSYPGGWATSATVIPAMDAGLQPFGNASAYYLYSTQGWRDNQNPVYDYGAVYLTSALGNTVGWFDYGYFSDSYLNPRLAGPAYIAGYPLDKDASCLDGSGSPVHGGCMWADTGSISNMSDQVFNYLLNSDTANGGEDGAPIWINDNGSLRAIGIHMFNASDAICNAYPGTNCGLRITAEMAANYTTWSGKSPITNCVPLSLTHTGNGSDPTPSPLKTAGCGLNEYVTGTTVNLTANPALHWKLDSWTGTNNDASTALTNTYTTTTSAHTITTAFSWICFSLTTGVNLPAGGSLIINPAPNCRDTLYGEGTSVSIIPSLNTGYGLQNWSGDASGNTVPLVVDMTANKSITANFAPANGIGTYDDASAVWTYTGTWSTYSGTGPYNNTDHYTSTLGSAANIRIYGNQIVLVYPTMPTRGSMDIYLDGVKWWTVNMYSASTVWQNRATSATFPLGIHDLSFRPAASTNVDLDAIQVIAPDYLAPAAVTSLAAVTGTSNGSINLTWNTPVQDASNPSSGPVSSYLVRYSRTNIVSESDWSAATPVTTGLPTPGAVGSAQAMTVSGLIPGLTYYIAVRGQDTAPNLGPIATASAAAKSPTPLGVGKYDDNHPSWIFSGTWIAWSGTGPYNNTDHYTSTVGSMASFTFTGRQFIFPYLSNTNRGNVEVSVDGTVVGTINANGPLMWQKNYISPIFSAGVHTVVFKFVGSGTYADVDAIQILNPDLIAPSAVGSLSASTGTTNGSIVLNWTAPYNDTGDTSSGSVNSYLVRYSLTDIVTETNWNAATPVTTGIPTPGAPGSSQTMTISGLISGATYYIAVRGRDAQPNLGPIATASAVAKAPTPVGNGKYDDNHASWVYGGTWMTYGGAGPYNNTEHYTSTVGSTASFTFSGSQFIFSFLTNTDRGNIEVSVDGGVVGTINAKAPLKWQSTYTSPVFAGGTHTVTFKFTGGGTYADVDAIQIVSPDTIPPSAVGSLNAVTGASNGGINLSWTAPMNDDGNPSSGPVTSYQIRYSTVNITNETEWAAATLVTTGVPVPGAVGANQSMTITGLVPGLRYYIAVRGQDTQPNLGPIVTASAVAKAPTPLAAGKYDDGHPSWIYSGTWMTYSGAGPYNNTDHYTSTIGSTASFTFSGGQFTFSYLANTNRGSIEVSVDGTLVATINANAPLKWQTTYTSPVFTYGTHTATFKFTGPSGTYADVDAIQIINLDTIAPSAVGSLTAATGTMGGSVDLSWTAPMNDDGNPSSGPVSSYLVRYSQTDIVTESDWTAATPVTVGLPTPGAPGTTQRMVISGLVPGLTYYVAVRGQDSQPNLGPIVTASAVAKMPTPVGPGTYDDTHAAWMFGGTWMTYSGPGPYNNTDHYTSTIGSTASFTFTGSQFIFWYLSNTNRGSIEVSVDGTLVGTINANGVLTWQKKYASPTFIAGTHTVVFKFIGPIGYGDVDAIQILP